MASRKRLRDAWRPVRGRAAVKAAAIAEPARKPPARKDTRSWCRGKEGREHVPVLAFAPPPWHDRPSACRWRQRMAGPGIAWECFHRQECANCGKVLAASWQLPRDECPSYPGFPAQRAAAGAEAAEAARRRAEWQARRRPVITGPQSYRRRRAS